MSSILFFTSLLI